MWLTRVNDRIRLMSAWATAPRAPTTMVSSATTSSAGFSSGVGKMTVSSRMIA